MTFEQIKETEAQSFMPTYGRFPVALASGQGAAATGVDGKTYIDFGSGIGVNSLGYCDQEWVEAVCRQASTLQHISNLYYSPVQVELGQKLCEVSGFSKVFLGNSGAEANECAVKLARKYSFDRYGEGRSEIVTLYNSFHGRTVTTLAATGQDSFHQYFFPFTEGFSYVKSGDIDGLLEKISDKTCAVMLECVQGEGGVSPIPQEFADAVQKVCRERDLLLIVDEVQTGVGRTGTFLASRQYGLEPDVVTLAKGLGGGLPIGACLCTERLGTVMSAGMHGSTFGGNPVVCAGALAVLNRVTSEGFLTEVAEKGDYLSSRLAALDGIREVRGLGMMIGAVLEKGTAREAASRCVEQGLLILTAKDVLRLLPPLTITYEEMDQGLEILKQVLASI